MTEIYRRIGPLLALFLMANACSAEGMEIGTDPWNHDAGADFAAVRLDPPPVEQPFSCCSYDVPETEAEFVADSPPELPPCPPDMVLVQGSHCPHVLQNCIEWIEDPRLNRFARCKVYEQPSVCKGERVAMRFCIDRLEAAAGDDALPFSNKSWTEAKELCASEGKRLCQQREWLFACEGEEARPYPYGYERSRDLCNFERTEGLVTPKGHLADHREPVASNPACVSPFGVQNMVGNIDEWVVLDRPHYSTKNNGEKMRSGLKGGWWGPLRNRCRPTTVDHGEAFHALQTGFRCCKDAE